MKAQKEITLGKPIFKQLTDENKTHAKIYLSLHNSIIADQYLLNNLDEKELIDYVKQDINKKIKIMEDIIIKTNLPQEAYWLLIGELNGKQYY